MDLSQLRTEIDSVDKELVRLFCSRMELSARVADYKKANDLPIHQPGREQKILEQICRLAGSEMAPYAQSLYDEIFRLSRDYQEKRNSGVIE